MTIDERIDRYLDDNKRLLDIINAEGTSQQEKSELLLQLYNNRAEIRKLKYEQRGLTPEDQESLSSVDIEHLDKKDGGK